MDQQKENRPNDGGIDPEVVGETGGHSTQNRITRASIETARAVHFSPPIIRSLDLCAW